MLTRCHECGAQVSTEAVACVRCGAPPRHPAFLLSELSSGRSSDQRASDHGSVRGQESDQRNWTNATDGGASSQRGGLLEVKEVSFKDIRFIQECPKCGSTKLIPLSRMKMNAKYPCKCGHTVPVELTNPKILENQKIVYRRFRDYFTYDGRLSVGEYWLDAISVYLLFGIASAFVFAALIVITESQIFGVLSNVFMSAMFHPMVVKRGHDLGFPGIVSSIPMGVGAISYFFIFVILFDNDQSEFPSVGSALLSLLILASFVFGLVIAFSPGQKKVNRYGPMPSKVKFKW